MVVSIPLVRKTDPRDPSVVIPFHLPQTLFWEESSGSSQVSSFSAGGAMLMKNRLIAWPALFYAIYSFNNAQPLRTKEGSSGGISSLGFAFVALLTVYFPSFLLAPPRA